MKREQTNELIQELISKGHHGGYFVGGTREEIENARLAKEQAEIDFDFSSFENCWSIFCDAATLTDSAEESARYDSESDEPFTLKEFRSTLLDQYYKWLVSETEEIFFAIGYKITNDEKTALEWNLIHSFRVLLEAVGEEEDSRE